MVPSIKASRPGPEHLQTITLPPPCLTVGMRFLLWNVLFGFRHYGTRLIQNIDASLSKAPGWSSRQVSQKYNFLDDIG